MEKILISTKNNLIKGINMWNHFQNSRDYSNQNLVTLELYTHSCHIVSQSSIWYPCNLYFIAKKTCTKKDDNKTNNQNNMGIDI